MSKPAPAARALLDQASRLWPDRSRISDGIVPSKAHTAANPNSDHEVGRAGYNHAVDLTHDPGDGCDCAVIAENIRLARDARVRYVIFNKRIFTSYPISGRAAWEWGPYSGGSNPHTKHMHVSLLDTKAACLDVSAWPLVRRKPKPRRVYRVVTAYRLNLRARPMGVVKMVLKKGQRVRQLERPRDGWVKVRRNFRTGYVAVKHTEVVR